MMRSGRNIFNRLHLRCMFRMRGVRGYHALRVVGEYIGLIVSILVGVWYVDILRDMLTWRGMRVLSFYQRLQCV